MGRHEGKSGNKHQEKRNEEEQWAQEGKLLRQRAGWDTMQSLKVLWESSLHSDLLSPVF